MDKADYYNNSGMKYLKVRKFTEALVEFNEAIKLEPNNYVYCLIVE